MKILLVEDEKKLAELTAAILSSENYQVTIAGDGEAALDQIYTHQFDLIILDWLLPRLNGLEVLTTMRQEKITTPVLFLTALDQTEKLVAGLDNGADDYLVKPFALKELLARARALTRRVAKTSYQQKTLTYGPLTIDLTARQAFLQQQPLPLSVKELAILTFLLQNQGQIFSKDYLLEKIWPNDTMVMPTTIEAHIKNLRAKIATYDSDLSITLIRTVRSQGYIIDKQVN